MISMSSQWHLTRQKKILSVHPEIKRIPKYDPRALGVIFLVPLIQAFLAYQSQFLNIWQVLILAWLLGSQCGFAMFNYSHELSHQLVHPSIKGSTQACLLHLISMVSLSPSIFILFNYGHKPHHAQLGQSTVNSAKRFLTEKYPDIELLIDRYYFELVHQEGNQARSFNQIFFKNRLLRLLSIGLIYPISSAIQGTVLAHLALMVKFIKSLVIKNTSIFHKRMNAIALHLLIIQIWILMLYWLAGPMAIVYLFLTEICQRGFLLHPTIVFPMTSHKAWYLQKQEQPTTSTYNQLISILLFNLNYHVEHHDFPDVPCRYLPSIKKIAPEYYNNLHHFTGIKDIFKQYSLSKHWYYAGVYTDVSEAIHT